eukprot:gene7604-10354_t
MSFSAEDDQPVLVVDIGSSSVKAGYSGEDVPSYVFPSIANKITSKRIESIEYEKYTGGQTGHVINVHPVHRGVVTDWGNMEKLWHNISEQIPTFGNDSASVFLVESPLSTFNDRVKWAEMLFETFRVPSICFGNSSSLTIFASGRTTGVAVECGAGLTSSVPIFEGLALKHAAVYADFGGQDITLNLKKILNDKSIMIDFQSAKSIKEKMCYVHGYSSKIINMMNGLGYGVSDHTVLSLPDGTDVTVESNLLSMCTDQLFLNSKSISGGLISQVCESITLCDDSVRRDLANNIMLSGGTSMLPGLGDRLNAELKMSFQSLTDTKSQQLSSLIKVIPTSEYREKGYSGQRMHAAWIGGSLMGSFDTYHKNLKITRQEWEENRDLMLHTRFLDGMEM